MACAEIGPESTARVLDAMAGDAERLLNGLQRAVETEDTKSFSLHAHSLKSNSLTVGAAAVGALFQELGTSGCEGSLVGVGARVRHAQAAYRKLIGLIVTIPGCDPARLSSSG